MTPTYEQVLEFLAWLRVPAASDPCDLNLLCLQGIAPGVGGALELNDNAPNRYNDAILLAHKAAAGEKRLACFLGTVDPGSVEVAGGVAHLTFGQHLYRPGLHQGQYRCLRSVNEQNRIWRRRENGEFYVQTGPFGVNVHAGSGTGLQVGNWSLGCINVWGGWEGAAYRYFLEAVETHFGVAQASWGRSPAGAPPPRRGSVGVTVWSGKDFARFAAEGWTCRPTLRLGMLSPWVGELQQLLTAAGFFRGTIDGDWQERTELAVRALQAAKGLPVDGVVGAATWTALGAA